MAQILFKINDNGKIIIVSYDENTIAEDFMLDFVKKNIGIYSIDPNIMIFKAGGKILNLPHFRKLKIKELIRNEQNIYVIRKQNVSYGPRPLDFTDRIKKRVGKSEYIWYM